MPKPLRVLVIGPKHASANSRGGMAEMVAMMRRCTDDRVRIRTVATFVDDTRARRLAVGSTGVLYGVALILLRRADLVHVHLAHRGSVVRKAFPLLAARAVGVPAAVHAHSYDFAGWYDGLGPGAARVVRWALTAPRWYVLGEGLATQYRDRLGLTARQVQVLRNPVQLPPEVPDRAGTGVVRAVSLGRLGTRKGTYDLVAALALMGPGARARLRVTVAGDGELEGVTAAAERAGVTDVFTIRSWVGPQERDALLADSEIFVLASYDEGLPLALLEAMAWGLAPVTTPVGGIPEAVTDGQDALLVPPGDPSALAAALESLVLDEPTRRAMGSAARATSHAFDEGAWFERLIADWTSLAARADRN